ncbi:MAG: hypothetical protein ACRDHN_17605 [Thermomicrobiales bacterium]
MTDYEMGGEALNDPSSGLQVKVWTCTLVGDAVTVTASGVPATALFELPGITSVSLSFDQNMRPAVAFIQEGELKLWWFDSAEGEQVFTTFDGEQPKIRLDDKRHTQNGTSDLLLAYVRHDGLYFREQRDRFLNEYFLADITGYTFRQMGMSTINRMQFAFDPIPVEP